MAIGRELFDHIRSLVPDGGTILELGSGAGTNELLKHYMVFSIEDDEEYLGLYDSHYIHAPIKPIPSERWDLGSWYDIEVLEKELPHNYDLILVDGPSYRGTAGRMGFWVCSDLFLQDVPIVFDDVQLTVDGAACALTAWKLRRTCRFHRGGKKGFGAIEVD
jgi:hypothetical protein